MFSLKTYWVRINCVWHKVTTSLEVYIKTPRAVIVGSCVVTAGGLAFGIPYIAAQIPISDSPIVYNPSITLQYTNLPEPNSLILFAPLIIGLFLLRIK